MKSGKLGQLLQMVVLLVFGKLFAREGGAGTKEKQMQCRPGWLLRMAVFLLIVGFFLPVAVGMPYYAANEPGLPFSTQALCYGGGAMFGALVLFVAYRVYRGNPWVEWDDAGVTFHFTRHESRLYRWHELTQESGKCCVGIAPSDHGLEFRFEDGKPRTILVSRLWRNYRAFDHALVEKGVTRWAGAFRKEDMEAIWRKMESDMRRGGQPQPRPARKPAPDFPHTLCPECGGTGERTKRAGIVQVTSRCKACGGSGYLEKR